jgi:iron(III) transport system permease protein
MAVATEPRLGRAQRRRGRAPAWLWMPAAGIATIMLLPVVYLVMRAVGASGHAVAEIIDRETIRILENSVLLAALVTAACTLLAVPLAWLTVRTDLPGRGMWAVFCAMPLAIPTYVGAFAYVAAFGPKGLIQSMLAPLGVQRLPQPYGLTGATIALTLFTFPYLMLIVRGALIGMDPSLEEASRNLGHSAAQTFRRVTLPHLRPAISAGGLLIALYTLSDFGAVSIMRFPTFTWSIYLEYQGSLDRTRAAALALILVALTLGVLAFEAYARGRARYHRSGSGARRQLPIVPLGRWRWPALGLCGVVVGLGLAVPLAVTGYWIIRGISTGQDLGSPLLAARNSLWASGLAAAVAAVAALPVTVLSVRFRGRLTALIERATYVGYALPGIVIALALVFFGIRYGGVLYQTLALLVFAYAVRFLPEAVGAIRASLLQVPPSVEEAARSLGRSGPKVLMEITAPLVRPGIVAGAALVFLTAMKELPATILLAPIGFRTLATEIWSGTEGAFFARAAMHTVLLLLLASVPLVLLLRRREGLT